MNGKVLHEYTQLRFGKERDYQVVVIDDMIVTQTKCDSGKWVIVDVGSGPSEIARLAKRIEALEKRIELFNTLWLRATTVSAQLEAGDRIAPADIKRLSKAVMALEGNDEGES